MEQPVVVWHVTPSRLVSRILMEGLMPSRWSHIGAGPQHHARISVCTDSYSVLNVLRRFMTRAARERHALLELSLPPGWVHVDSVGGEATVGRRVMPELIRVLVPDLDEWDGTYPDGFAPAGWRRIAKPPIRRVAEHQLPQSLAMH